MSIDFISDISQKDFSDISLEFLGGHLLFGDIDSDSIKDAASFIIKANQILPPQRELSIFINSQGGNVYDGFGLIDLMSISRLQIKTIGLGHIASMAVLILSAGTPGKRILTKNTTIMAHQFSGGAEGKFHEIMESYKADIRLRDQFLYHFGRTTKMNKKQINDILFGPSDKYLTPTECKKYGICDVIIDELPNFDNAK